MENSIDGQIEFVQVPHLKSVQQFVKKRVGQWVEQYRRNLAAEWESESSAGKPGPTPLRAVTEKWRGLSANPAAFFYVKFEKIGGGHQIFCTIQLIIGNRYWKGTALAAGLHRALIQSMGHLTSRFERPVVELREVSGTVGALQAAYAIKEPVYTSPNVMGLKLVR